MTDDHLSLDELAQLDEGLLPPERISAIRAHLHGCAECQARAEAITATRSILADLPPATMPDDVKARLDDALAAEAEATKRTTPLRAVPGQREDVAPERPAVEETSRTATVTPKPGSVSRPRFGQPSMAAIAVAATFVLAGGAVVVGHLRHHDKPSVSTAGSDLGTVGLPSVVLTPSAGQGTNFTTTSTGIDYNASNLPNNVVSLINTAGAGTTSTDGVGGGTSTTGGPGTGGGSGAIDGGGGTTNGGTAAGGSSSGGSSSKGSGSGAARGDKKHPRKFGTSGKQSGGGRVVVSPSQPVTTSPVPTVETLANEPVPHALKKLAGSRRAILQCAAVVSGTTNAVPLTVDFGHWTNADQQTVPAAIFVFKSPNPNFDVVYVTAPACDGTLLTFNNVQIN